MMEAIPKFDTTCELFTYVREQCKVDPTYAERNAKRLADVLYEAAKDAPKIHPILLTFAIVDDDVKVLLEGIFRKR